MSEYVTSKEDCEKSIKGVCEGCGGKLSAFETIDDSGNPTFWVACERCCKFRAGIEPKYFRVARRLVGEGIIRPYTHMLRCDYEDTPEHLEYYLATQTEGLSRYMKYIETLLTQEDHQ